MEAADPDKAPRFPLRSVFLALPLEDKAKWLFRALQEKLKEYEEILFFQNPQSPHLTLQFWPELMEIEYAQILRQADHLAATTTSFPLSAQGVSTFGGREGDRVIFLDVPFSEPLARLRKACPWESDRPFLPHITLARIRHPQRFMHDRKKIMKRIGDAAFSMDASLLRLYAEVNGRKQTPLKDFPFGMDR